MSIADSCVTLSSEEMQWYGDEEKLPSFFDDTKSTEKEQILYNRPIDQLKTQSKQLSKTVLFSTCFDR